MLDNGYMIVGSSWYSTATVSGITYNSLALTKIGSDSANSGFTSLKCSQYRRVAPSSGANTVAITLSASTNEYIGGAITLSGVDQTTPEDTQARAEGSSTTATVAAGSAADDWVVDVVARLGSGAAAAGAGQTERWDLEAAPSTAIFGWGSTETATGASTTMSSTFSAADWAICAVAVKPAAGGLSIVSALTGAGSLAAVAAISIPLISAITGAGNLLGLAAVQSPIIAALSGAGNLASVTAIQIPITSALTGTGSLLSVAAIEIPITSALVGTGNLSSLAIIEIPVLAALTGSGTATALVATEAGGVEWPITAALAGTGNMGATVTLIAVTPNVGGGGSDRWVWEGLRRPRPLVKRGGAIHVRIPINIRAAQPEVLIPVSGGTGIAFESWITASAGVILDARNSSLVIPPNGLTETRTLVLSELRVSTQINGATYEILVLQNQALRQELRHERESMVAELAAMKEGTEALAILFLSEGL